MQQTEILTREQVADLLQISRSWLDHSKPEDQPRFHRVGRGIRYYKDDVKDWLNSQTYTPPAKKTA